MLKLNRRHSSNIRIICTTTLLLIIWLNWDNRPIINNSCNCNVGSSTSTPPPPLSDKLEIGQLIDSTEQESIFDKYRLFKTKPFFSKGSEWNSLSSTRRACLGAQTSIDRINWLLQTVKNWSGPISIALFAPGVEFHISVAYIRYLKRCNPGVERQVSFHLTFPSAHTIAESNAVEAILNDETPCSDLDGVLSQLMMSRPKDMMAWRESFAHPQNLLRNVAKSGCQTNYTFIPDIDMIPIPELDLDLESFLSSQTADGCEKCAFVIPTYEISTIAASMPREKEELVELVSQNKARYFHQTVHARNQESSDLARWISIPLAEKMEVAYKVENYVFAYEPLYVSRGDTPPFDERFIGFGNTRNTQVYEMYVAGYSFNLLNNAFTNHWGYQSLASRPEWRAKQQELNNRVFDEFVLEVTARYGRDPYNMTAKLKGMNRRNVRVVYSNQMKQ